MSRRATATIAWTLGGLASAGAVAIVVLATTVPKSPNLLLSSTGISVCIGIGFSLVGALIASRRPDNAIGWIMIGIALSSVAEGLAIEYAILAWTNGLPGTVWAAWLQQWVSLLIAPTGLLLLLLALFPTGHSLSPRWRPLMISAIVWTSIIIVVAMTLSGPLDVAPGFPRFPNPLGVLPASGKSLPGAVLWVTGLGLLLMGVVEAVIRLRRSTGDERQQMKWFVYAGGGSVLLYAPLTILSPTPVPEALANLMLMLGAGIALPVACGVAIFKYRLYEIDVVVNKTVVYGLLAAFVTIGYVAIVVGIGAAVGSRGNVFLSIVATAVVAVSFQPARERARRLANRLIYGKRASPYDVLSRFADRVGDVSAIDDLLPRWPASWGRERGQRMSRCGFAWARPCAEALRGLRQRTSRSLSSWTERHSRRYRSPIGR